MAADTTALLKPTYNWFSLTCRESAFMRPGHAGGGGQTWRFSRTLSIVGRECTTNVGNTARNRSGGAMECRHAPWLELHFHSVGNTLDVVSCQTAGNRRPIAARRGWKTHLRRTP